MSKETLDNSEEKPLGFFPMMIYLKNWLDEHYPEDVFVGDKSKDKGVIAIVELRYIVNQVLNNSDLVDEVFGKV